MTARRLSVLGSTGSVGRSTLDFLDQSGAEVEMFALVAGRDAEQLAMQARRWRPRLAVVGDQRALPELRARLAGEAIECAAGPQAVIDAASETVSWTMCAIAGFAGLAPTLAAASSGATLALANKESLICVGPALLNIAQQAGSGVIPVDSEHSAIFQVLDPRSAPQVARLTLTASGGPFRGWTCEQMARATPEQALAHPRWAMGRKISIDSATMMNKAFEIIEAAHLFAMPVECIDVLVHPEAIVHSLVEYADGSTLAQLGVPDMRVPIACAFAWPQRLAWPAPRLDLAAVGRLTFEAPAAGRFPALRLAAFGVRQPAAAAAMNAADEVAVEAFLDRRIGFSDIVRVVEASLEAVEDAKCASAGGPLEIAIAADAAARRRARTEVRRLSA